ncbi:hypothetical protein B0T26DRAFT_370925 [Lasiosphaeria miniovina]|uniref:Transmembrane protein UsgS n=1 Tax=Lasiosphaeria miniovina TaxID=1954250 RepID=A0AA40ADB9_9PEZI|nr:uncharacterized protein B0T26DRAFT_370925 [Lasiosphaeria miniovina]KAK0713783.1 hypothetical protein B0T26DRAFT_370925 [Lasiosphaeria miniovina]
MASAEQLHIDREKLKQKLDTSHFDLNAVFRGAQLTLVGAFRALRNPDLFDSQHYRQAMNAIAAGIAIRALIAIPILFIKSSLWASSFVFDLDHVSWDNKLVNGLGFIEEHVLQAPLFFMSLMRYITPTLDDLFMDSLKWVDMTYVQKHKHDQDPGNLRAMYYPALKQYPLTGGKAGSSATSTSFFRLPDSVSRYIPRSALVFLYRYVRKGLISLAIFATSYLPVVGRLVLPAASFWTFNQSVGLGPASIVFGAGVFVPKKYLVIFLQSYFASRSLMRELLDPYFARIRFTKEEKRKWFRNRQGILFGFGVGFYILLRIPLLGVLIYGIAEASTAYLITKITDPPPPVSQSKEFTARQVEWNNKHKFLSLSLANMDTLHDDPLPYQPTDPYPRSSVGQGVALVTEPPAQTTGY